jgi:hypothetical protein
VACATLAAAALLNAPPAFLEFLLCVPWTDLGRLYSLWGPGAQGDQLSVEGESALHDNLPQLRLSDDERSALVNQRVSKDMLGPLLDFIYGNELRDSLPPMLRPEPSPDQDAVRSSLFCGPVLNNCFVIGCCDAEC